MRVDRLLSIVLIIANKKYVTGYQLAEHFEVSLRTIYRDIEKLGLAGIPIASIGGKGGGYYLMDNYNINNLFLNKGEAKTFLSVMNSLDILFGKNQHFNDIVLKFENSNIENSNDKLSINMSHFSMEEELKTYLYIINNAIEESRLLSFDYINRRMEYEQRVTEPLQIAFVNGDWYLNAFCQKRNDYRQFKLLRIRNLNTSEHFYKRDISSKELIKIFYDSFESNSIKVLLKFSGRMEYHLTEKFRKERIQITENGEFLVKFFSPHEEGLLKFILSFGNDCEVLEPNYLREEIKNYLLKIQNKYID